MIIGSKAIRRSLRQSRLYISVLLLLTAYGLPAFAHPHVFVDYGVSFVFDQQGIAGIAVDWAFDEMFTQMLLEDGDLNGDRHFDSREIGQIKQAAFDNLVNHAYFIHILVNGQPRPVTETTGFNAFLDEDRAHYTFFVPCSVPAGSGSQSISLTLYDTTYYTDLALLPEGVTCRGPVDRYHLRHEAALAQEVGFPQAPLMPDGILLEFQIK